MAVSHFTGDHYQGLSSDSKPTANVGSTFLETDTGDRYVNVNGASTWAYLPRSGGRPVLAVGTGSAAIAVSSVAVAAGTSQRLTAVTVHLSAAPTTAGSLTIILNANAGAAYDTLLYSVSMVGVTDLLWQPDQDIYLVAGSAIDVAYANADGRTFGVEIMSEVR